MKKYLINYADDNYIEAQKYCTRKAYEKGKFDCVKEYTPTDIPKEIIALCVEGIYGDNRKAKRYGLWRPYIIKKTLDEIEYEDFLCYCDAGGYFIRNVSPIINDMIEKNQNIRVYGLPLIEKQWTKRDVFIYFNADRSEITDSNQIMSSYFFVRKTEESLRFFEEYLNVSLDAPELFTDAENIRGKDNYPEFIENRHNQSVLSILCKVHGIEPCIDISEYGMHQKLYSYSNGVIYVPVEGRKHFPYFISHRKSKVTLMTHVVNFLRIFLPSKVFISIYRVASLIYRTVN